MATEPCRLLRDLLQAALEAVEGGRCTAAALRRYPLRPPVWAAALGKAAPAMLRGALEALGPRLEAAWAAAPAEALAATPLPAWVEGHAGGHPLPDAGSLAAGEALVAFLGRAPREASLLFLISGGSSALVELPAPGVDLPLLRRANAWLLGSGLDIAAVNAVRRRLSRLKGGGLLRWLGGRPALALLISDVPGDDPAVIGSGPLFPPREEPPLPPLPSWLARRLPPPAPPPPPHPALRWEVVATAARALEAAAEAARRRGLRAHLHAGRLAGEAAAQGERLARFLLEEAAPGVHLWAGETTVRLPPRPGRGGRCQHLALAAARLLAGRGGVALLAAGSDGRDGPTDAAGACVDGATLAQVPCDAAAALARADSGPCLEAAGALLRLGPTGTNVADLLLGWVSGGG